MAKTVFFVSFFVFFLFFSLELKAKEGLFTIEVYNNNGQLTARRQATVPDWNGKVTYKRMSHSSSQQGRPSRPTGTTGGISSGPTPQSDEFDWYIYDPQSGRLIPYQR